MNDIAANWIKLAEYDMATAEAMFQTGRYIYVAFTCQQAIEKMLKALVVIEHNETPPYTHNLIRLLHRVAIAQNMDARRERFIETLNSYYIESRYTENMDELSATLTQNKTQEILNETRKLFTWLQHQITP